MIHSTDLNEKENLDFNLRYRQNIFNTFGKLLKVARYGFYSLCTRAVARFLWRGAVMLVNLNCTDNYDVVKLKVKSVTDHQ